MSLTDRVHEWVASCPAWQQELFLRVLPGAAPSDDDLDAVLDLIIGRTSTIDPREVERADLPADLNSGASVSLLAIKHHEGVNRLGANEELLLIPQGLNVIYGHNGSGKSGWVRIPKHAGRAHASGPVLGDVYRDPAERPVPRAEVRWELDGDARVTKLSLDMPAPVDLAGTYVFDASGGNQLLIADHEIDYVPLGLRGLQRLRAAQARIGARIDQRSAELQRRNLDPALFSPGTKVRETVEALTAETDVEALRELARLTPDAQQRMQELARQVAEIDSNNADALIKRYEREAQQLAALNEALMGEAAKLSAGAIGAARHELDALRAAQDAAAAMSVAQFEREPLGGVGSGPWSTLWESARRFVAEEHRQELPPQHDPAHCPLCMQLLSDEAKDRLARFDAFVRSDVEKRLVDAQANVARRLQSLPAVGALRQAHAAAIQVLDEHEQLRQSLSDWLNEVDAAANAMRAAANGVEVSVPTVAPTVAEPLRLLASGQSAKAEEHRRLQDPEADVAVRKELAELRARATLGQHLASVEARIGELAEMTLLQQAKDTTSGRAVSTKIGALTKEFVTGDLERALRTQLSRLNFHDLEVVGCKTSGREGSPRVGLVVKAKDNVSIQEVLSDGEQRRLALAFFLAEISVATPGQPVVLDDPVCSVDHLGRRHIARTLTDIAKERQVVVFTHELAFLHELQVAAKSSGVQLAGQHVIRANGRSGQLRPELPWAGKGAGDRRRALNRDLQDLEALHRKEGESDAYRASVMRFCERLREAFERAIEDQVVAGVITRGDFGVHPQLLKNVAWSTEICALADQGLAESSPWVHDRSRSLNPALPTPDEVRAGLDVLTRLLQATGKLRSTRQAEVKARLQIPGQSTLDVLEAEAS